jgi:hypothetical protein
MNARYPGSHQSIRRRWAPLVDAGQVACWRCGRPIIPGTAWDLGHDDNNRAIIRGPEHAGPCNRAAGGRLGRARQRQRERITRMLTECVLAVEISEDRRHTSIAAAGDLADGFPLVELPGYLDGPAAGVDAVLELRRSRKVVAVVVDGRSHSATLLKPLQGTGVRVTQPTTSDVAVAHGLFLDELNAGRLRHDGHPALTAAVRHATARPLSGAQAWERRGHEVDVAPVTAATLALWGWMHRPPKPMIVVSGQAR